MNSSIKVALDGQRNPIIKINYIPSDDLRDDVLKRFIEGIGESSTLEVAHNATPFGSGEISLTLKPNERNKS